MNAINKLIAECLLSTIGFYRRRISPALGMHCRFYPTCSDYAQQAIQKKGVWKGVSLALGRLLKCHPFHPGGVDDVK